MLFPSPFDSSEQPLLQTVLEPLLDDFQDWFREAEALLNSPKADRLDEQDRESFRQEVMAAQQEISTARTLLLATGGQAGVETSLVFQWHQLVGQYWQIARALRQPR